MKSFRLNLLIPALLLAASALADPVDPALAEAVASRQVASFFPGEAWVAVDCVEAVDADGAADAWAVVFALEGSGFESPDALQAAVLAGADGTDGESGLYAATATVVTGADDTDSLVFRTFRGLADWYQLRAASGGEGDVVRLGAGDIRFAPSSAAASRRGAPTAKALKKTASARAAKRAAEKEALPDELRELAETADEEAHAAAKARWGEAAGELRKAGRTATLRKAGKIAE